MRSILPDEKTLSTPLEMMTSFQAALWIIFTAIFVTLAAIFSFAPANTNYLVRRVWGRILPSTSVSNRAQFPASPLNSFNILSVIPYVSQPTQDLEVNLHGIARLYDKSMKPLSLREINKTVKINCPTNKCDEIIATTYNFVDFKYSLLVADVQSHQPILRRLEITSTSLNPNISIIFFVLITVMTLVLIYTLIFVVPKRLYPTRSDHWSTLFLGLAALCIDGPWLILKYYSSYWFSNIYDIMPEIYHIVYILFIMSFFNAMTNGWVNRILGSWLLSLVIAIGLITIIILESIATNYLPLNTASIFLHESPLQIPIYVLTFIMHAAICGLLFIGVTHMQIPDDATLVLTSLDLVVVEVLDIVRVCLRFWCPRTQLGYSFAADVCYILVANYITSFMLNFNLPVAKALDVEKSREMENAIIPQQQDNADDPQPLEDVEAL